MRSIKHIVLCLLVTIYSHLAYAHENLGGKKSEQDGSPYEGISVEIPKKTQELIELKTQTIESSSIKEKVSIMGRIIQDTEHTTDVVAAQSGTLKECKVNLGDSVSKGQLLCTIDSNGQMLELKSPSDGVVMAQFSSMNDPVDTVSPIFMLADLSQLVAAFDVYERDLAKIKKDQKVLVYTNAYPQKTFEGRIIFVSPRVDERSFTVKVRVSINNESLLLKPGMFLRGEILIEDEQIHLNVPIDAIQNMDGTPMVFIQDGAESFTAVKVDMQLASNKQAFIEGDLKSGDVIVTEGSYMLKSKIMESEISGGHSH